MHLAPAYLPTQTFLVQPTIIPCKDCCRSLLFPASTFSPQPFCNTISKSVLITSEPDHVTSPPHSPSQNPLGFPFHSVPCDHADLRTQSLHSSPTGLLTRHTFASQGLHTYYSAGMLSPWYLTSTRPQFHTGLQLNIILSQGPFLIIQFKSAFTSLSILLPCLIFLHCSHKYLTYYMSH